MSDSPIKGASEDESLAIEWALTSEDEDMPPEMQEEEGEEDDDCAETDEEDEKEEEDIDVIAESRHSVPTNFSNQELTIMMNAKPQWMSCRGAARKKILETMHRQLYKLDACKGLNKEAWLSQVQGYKTWFYNQCQSGANDSHIMVRHSWTACDIIQETQKMIINEVIHERYGKKPGTKEVLSVYQKVVHRVVNNLTEEEWDEAKNTVAKWNLDHGPPNEVKARQVGGSKPCFPGVHTGDVAGVYSGDFNGEIVDGEKFQCIHKISAAWDKYMGTYFEPQGEPNTDDADSEEESNPKQKQTCKRPNPTTQVTHEDGAIWIGDLVGNSIETPSSTSHMEQRTRGKGKGKEKDKGKAPAESVMGVWDTGKMQPSKKVATKSAGRPQPRQKGTAKSKAQAPSSQAIKSKATMQISVMSQPTKMPKAKHTSKKVNPGMILVLGSKQESDTNNNTQPNKPASPIVQVPVPSSKPVNKSNYPSQRSRTPHPNNESTMHQKSMTTSSTPVHLLESKIHVDTDQRAGHKVVFMPKADAIANRCSC
ncbi:hypothetical protein PAXRUDRAFT_160127 [Paxillus rubicundulus Ve08.2h10]|uniref:Uncharacterized protein n=1 Tax=Paxillus rubicundulus Ve08.2h10 TaxID=930991 RepID=A0A0D0DMY8_9AGAM|nr:hypothetical protein PAXRUDRAFT_160127 [Paxillus rubicundulus Ve08.2h10]